MSISIVRLGSPRKTGEGPSLGIVRRPPGRVPKRDSARLYHYDTWTAFARKYRREMSSPDRSRELDALAAR